MKKLAKMLAVLALALSVVGCSSEKKSDEITTLEVQFVPTNVETADGTSADFEAYLENLLDMDVNVTVATSYNTIVEAMKSGKTHVGIMPPATYVIARESDSAISILSSTLVDYDQETEQPIAGSTVGTFKAEIVMKKDAAIESYKDFEGKTIARLGTASASGYIYPVAEMIEAGVDLSTITFVEILDMPSAMRAVYDGEVDACYVFEGARYVFQNAVKDSNGNAIDVWENFKVMLSEGDIPNDAVAVLPTLGDELTAKVKQAFLDMAADEEGLAIMSSWGHTGYVESDEAAYDSIAAYMEKAASEE